MDKKFIVAGLLVCMYGQMIIEDNSYSHPIYYLGVPKEQGEFLVGLGLILMAYGFLKKIKTQEQLGQVEQSHASETILMLMLIRSEAKVSKLKELSNALSCTLW